MKKSSTIRQDRLNSQPLSLAKNNASKQETKAKAKERVAKVQSDKDKSNKGLRHSLGDESVSNSESKQSIQTRQTRSE